MVRSAEASADGWHCTVSSALTQRMQRKWPGFQEAMRVTMMRQCTPWFLRGFLS